MQSKIFNFPVQYSFLESREESERKAMQEKINILESSLNKQRKAQFAKIGEINKKTIDLEERMEILEKGLCTNKL